MNSAQMCILNDKIDMTSTDTVVECFLNYIYDLNICLVNRFLKILKP